MVVSIKTDSETSVESHCNVSNQCVVYRYCQAVRRNGLNDHLLFHYENIRSGGVRKLMNSSHFGTCCGRPPLSSNQQSMEELQSFHLSSWSVHLRQSIYPHQRSCRNEQIYSQFDKIQPKACNGPCSEGTGRYRGRCVGCRAMQGSAQDRDRSHREERSRICEVTVSTCDSILGELDSTYFLTSVYQ